MIKTFNVDNFKSLNNLSINLQPMTVIVGNNATGKSSILQDRKSTRLNSSHNRESRMPSSA